jgi:hypothetical protein
MRYVVHVDAAPAKYQGGTGVPCVTAAESITGVEACSHGPNGVRIDASRLTDTLALYRIIDRINRPQRRKVKPIPTD